MSRRGVALLLVLWLIVLLAGIVAVGLGGSQTGLRTSQNRVALLRAAWARDACLAILLGRAARHPGGRLVPERLALDHITLGDGMACRASVQDPDERIDLNRAPPALLVAALGDSATAAWVVAGRPWPDPRALPARLDPWRACVTVRGSGRINVTRAPREVLRLLPGVGDDGAVAILAARGAGRAPASVDELLTLLATVRRAREPPPYQALLAMTAYQTEVFEVLAIGWREGDALVQSSTVLMVPAGGRLALLRQEAP